MAEICVRVEPPCIEFNDVKIGEIYKTTVRATNVGKTPKKIVIDKPILKVFRFSSSSAGFVAPGLSVSGLLEFTPEEDEEVRDSLLIHVNDVETIKIPVLGLPRVCSLTTDSLLDFGSIPANSEVISKHHPITNQGTAPGLFQVHYDGDPSLRLFPCSGVIAAGATQWIKVELQTDGPRQIYERALVKLQNHSAVVLRIKAKVVDQHLEIFDMQGTPLSCLWFGPVYFGTSCIENVVLRNNSPQTCDWVCLLQSTLAGTEVGTDLQKSTDAALLGGMKTGRPATQDVSQVVVCDPKQGQLGPHDQITVAVRFSPVCSKIKEAKKEDSSPGRQDYCLFLLFESVGSKHGFTHQNAHSSVELAVTGSGLPVSLVPSPSHRFDFLTCVAGQRVDLLCVLQNLCPQLPVTFCFRKVAHFTTKPASGEISPGQCQDVVLSFTARQQGSFRTLQKLDILGHVVKRGDSISKDVTKLQISSFHTITLRLSAVCRPETTQPGPKLSSVFTGIAPAVSNPTGSQPHRRRDLARCCGMVRAAVLSADKTQLNMQRKEKRQEEEEELLAFPNDSACRQYRTIFPDVHRDLYVDAKYSFTEKEEEERQRHRHIYRDFIQQLRQKRLLKIKERQQEKVEDDDVDIGIVPAQGLIPPTLRMQDLEPFKIFEIKPKYRSSLKDRTPNTQEEGSQVSEVMHAVPSTSQEMADCNRTLTAQELYQVEIGPLLVDFGEVCAQSVCITKLELINRLSVFAWMQLEVDCSELQGSSPLSHVLPPHSHSSLSLTFQSNKLGPFYRPVSYSVNQKHLGQILVKAQVVPVALEMSTTVLVLRPTPNLLAQSGYRNSVTLVNKRNHPAEFTWKPVVTEKGILFSIRPAAGTVEPYQELDCEVVWHPSFSSPAEGDFDLCVHEGDNLRLHCVAKVGGSSVQLAQKQLQFGSVPLNMPSVRAAVLHNTGQNHAYYQVLDVCPLPGMVVSPSEGVVPSGGQAVLSIHFSPDSVIRFDTRVKIALRNMKSVELRVGGSVEPPNVEISVSKFQFHGVHAGSLRAIPFTLTNHSPAVAQVTFDLSEHTDFSVKIPQPSANKEPGVTVVEVQGCQTLDCSLLFFPTQAASYDIDLPLKVNGVRWPSAASFSPSPTPPSSVSTSSSPTTVSRHHVVKPHPQSVSMATQQPQRIQATVLCAPLEISPHNLQFNIESSASDTTFLTQTVELKAVSEESVFWRGGVREHVSWSFDCSAAAAQTEEGREGGLHLCTVTPPSGCLGPGQTIWLVVSINPEAIRAGSDVTKLLLPLHLGEEEREKTEVQGDNQPYRELSITITRKRPYITIHPSQILLTPVPLATNASASVTLLACGYPRGTTVSAEVDEVKLEDGKTVQPVSVIFPEGRNIPAQNQHQRYQGSTQDQGTHVDSLICSVLFCSAVPLSLCTTVTFTDHLNNRFQVKLCAIADSCQLTVWPYMALHRSDHQIVLKTGTTAVEAILQSHPTPSPAHGPNSSSSSLFDLNSSTIKTLTSRESYSGCESVNTRGSRNSNICPHSNTPTNLGFPEFPAANSEEGLYYQTVLLAVQRWFSLFGWPGGPHPISIPHTLRRNVSGIQINPSGGRTYQVSLSKDSRSVVDMLHHLTGKQILRITCCQAFSSDVDKLTKQLLQQHGTMLAFLSVQGACLGHIRPEYLLDTEEFKHWCSLQAKKDEYSLDYSNVDYESLSKRSWTDVLLQVYKVLVLCRVSLSGLNKALKNKDLAEILPVSSAPLDSNIYSSWELQLLSWLNIHYQGMRKTVWEKGNVPSARWIVNFDLDLTDGLVLAALLASYCPYLICSHFRRMYTTTRSLEQILHNNIIMVQALNALCLNIDLQPTDLSDPNPVQMLMLCVHLSERLPQYLPLHTVTLSGSLHSTLSKQVLLKSPSSKPVKYQVFLLGEDAHLFSVTSGSAVTVLPKASAEVSIQSSCSFIKPKEATLLLISSPPVGLGSTTLTFNLKTHVSSIKPTKTVKCKSPCYQLKEIQVPITNPFDRDATFRVVLEFNPLEPEKKRDSLVQQASSTAKAEKTTSDKSCGEEMEGKPSDLNGGGSEFLCSVSSVHLKSGQEDTLIINYLPFCPGTKCCSVLLVCPQVGDMVFLVKATAELPLPSPLTARPSPNVVSIPQNSDPAVCVSVLSLCCRVGQLCEEVLRVPLVNMAWEQALAIWGQHSMSAEEHQRRMLTHTLHSSTVRATTAARKLVRQQATKMKGVKDSKGIEYSVDVSLPQFFTFPSAVTIPVKEDISIPWENPADCGCVDIPFQLQADFVGRFTCQVVLQSWCDTRVFMLEAEVTSQGGSVHLDFRSPAHRSLTQEIPLHNETLQDWEMHAELHGEGFTGPKVVSLPAGTKASYPLTFQPTAECTVMGKLSLHNNFNGTELVFTLRGVGERPLPVDYVVVRCPVGESVLTLLDVPNYSQRTKTLKVVTDLSVVSGASSLEIKPGHTAPYSLTVSPWRRGKQTGCVSFVEVEDLQEGDDHKASAPGPYELHYSLEIICEPAAPAKVIYVQCVAQGSVTIEIPVSNPRGELLMLDVFLKGDNLSGANWVSIPPRETLTYKAAFSPVRVGKSTGSVLFQSELVGEFWYQLELYALPPPSMELPQACCHLGKWTRQTIPLVNPTDGTLEIIVSNSNPRNFTLEMDSGNRLIVEPHSFAQLGVHFSPSSIGEGNHAAKITFLCPQLQDWCVSLSGKGLKPEREEPLNISAPIGTEASITIPFTNPTELPAVLSITLTDVDPSEKQQDTTHRIAFSIPLSQTKDVYISEGACLDIPLVFEPNSMDVHQAWLCITMKPHNSSNASSRTDMRSEEELSTICWIYPLRGIPVKAPVEKSQLGVLHCEAGCQLEKKVDVLLTGCVTGNQDRRGHGVPDVTVEDFQCKINADGEAEDFKVQDFLSVSIKAAVRNPETGIVTLALNVVCTPLKPCRCAAVLTIQSDTGRIWEFPVTLVATEPQIDDVILIDATEVGRTSAVGFRLTSTTRRAEPFTAALLPGSGGEFTVTPASGVLPPVGSTGALITVSFTPKTHCNHRARLIIQADDMQWIYELRANTLNAPMPSPPLPRAQPLTSRSTL